jgi:hypothetical protein
VADLRLRGLDSVDPRAVPLPAGTEVVTRVERSAGERVIKQGAVGRVVRVDGDELEVQVVGLGRARYLRRELIPRKRGQLEFARRRAAAWQALQPCVVLEAVVGSRAWGLAGPGSDEDRRGVFALPFPWTTGLVTPPEDLASDDGTAGFWELGKAVRQALRADPNTLEMLFVDGVRARDPVGEALLAARDAFPSREIYGSFGRYALAQLDRLAQAARLARHRAEVLAWLRDEPELDLDAVAARLAASATIEAPTPADAARRARDYLKQLYRSLHDQGLLDGTDFAALARFARGAGADLELPRELRPKNAYNLVRLIAVATTWLRTGRPALRVEGALRDELLAIKAGAVPLEAVLERAEAMTPALEDARHASPLPERGDLAVADRLLGAARAELARRHLAGEPGPFGADAPPAPAAQWVDEEGEGQG